MHNTTGNVFIYKHKMFPDHLRW